MDTCTNCGATLRPGAKFCTTCGTRLNETLPENTGWGTPRSTGQDDSQQTSLLNVVPTPENSDDPGSVANSPQQSKDAWSEAYSDGSTTPASDDPASRFISALDRDVQPVEKAADQSHPTDPESTWQSTTPAFTPPPPSNWSYSGSSAAAPDSDAASKPADSSEIDDWHPPASWNAVKPVDESSDVSSVEPDADGEVSTDAELSEGAADEVDDLGGDEVAAASDADSPQLPPDEARDRAIELADELRRTIRMIGGGGESDHGAAVMALTEASIRVGDFSDVRGVIADVQSDPRDIQKLTELAGKVDRIEALLDEHKSLADAIETAIREMNGY